MGYAVLRDILVIFIFAVPAVLIAQRLRFPSIVGFLMAGVIIGPHALGLVPDIEEIRVLAEVGVALLLFSIGLEFSFERLRGWGAALVEMGVLQITLTALAGLGLALLMGFSVLEGVLIGCAIALSSTAIVMAILSSRRWFDSPAGRITTGILILQDLAVIPMMAFLMFLKFPEGASAWKAGGMAFVKLSSLAGILFVVHRFVLQPFLHHVSKPRSKELFVVVVVGFAVGASYLTEQMGLSFALGAFLAGLLVSATDYRFHALSEIAPFRYCFNGLFFVSVGMIVDPVFIYHNAFAVGLFVMMILFVKTLVAGGIVFLLGYPVAVALVSALMLAQVGEFSFLFVFTGWRGGLLADELYHLIVDASVITMGLAPFVVAFAPNLGERLSHITWRLGLGAPLGRRQISARDEGLSNHAIICGFGPLGMTIGKILERHSIPYVILELNPMTAAMLKDRGQRVFIGDGASSALLHHSGVEKARLLAIAVPDHMNSIAIISQARRMNPSIHIVARGRYRDHCPKLYETGADVVVCEELEAGIEMGRYVMAHLNISGEESDKIIKEIRSFGSADFF